MINLISLIKELGINKPIPKFKSDEELMGFLNSNSNTKDEFINLVVNEYNFNDNDPEWGDVIRGWRQNNVRIHDNEVGDLTLMLPDNDENIIYFTLLDEHYYPEGCAPGIYEIQLGPNIIYFKYY